TEHPTWRRRQTGVTIRDTPTVTKKKTPEQPLKLKGMEMLSDAAILVADTKKALKASKHDFRSQHQTGGSCEGAGSEPEILNKSKGKTKDTNEWVGSKPEVPDVYKAKTESDDDKSIDLNKIDDEEEDQGDEFVHTPDDYVRTDDETQDMDDEEYHQINEELYGDVNVEMQDVEPIDEGKEDEEMNDAEKLDVERTEINQEVASAKVQDEVQTITTAAHAT
ncbi:hypothetical protein Tco_1514101, partial [Tanacetum coccineum]